MEINRSQHYIFAFFTLPLLALSNTKETYKKLDRYDRVHYLKSLWNGLGDRTGNHLSDEGLNCSIHKLQEDKVLFVIQLPAPEIQPEAYLVGLLFTVVSDHNTTEAVDAECYTLELSKNFHDNSEAYVLGEMVPGDPFPNLDHLNYGMIPLKDERSFITAIQALLNG